MPFLSYVEIEIILLLLTFFFLLSLVFRRTKAKGLQKIIISYHEEENKKHRKFSEYNMKNKMWKENLNRCSKCHHHWPGL